MESLLPGLELALTFDNLLLAVIGLTVGIFIGAVPGLNVPMAVALALPFTFALTPLAALALLIGIYKGGTYGGSISAVLINVPGTPAAAAAAIDGNAMARQGKGGKALRVSLYASVAGELMADLALIALAIPLAAFALSFGPAEYFSLGVFALTIIGLVSADNLTKGLIAGAAGVFLSTVGLDPLAGQERLTFGVSDLRGGISFIALIIGMFAIAELLIQIERSAVGFVGGKVVEASGDKAAHGLSRREWRQCVPSVLRGTPIGIFIGAVPGLGSAVAAYLSYGLAKRFSRRPEAYGKGSMEGVAAAECANNAVCSSTMIPLLALGVPGDVITAIMIGAFAIHGIVPGPALFQQQADLVTGLFILMALTSILHLVVGRVGLPVFVRALDLPRAVLFPAVMLICLIGTYVATSSFFAVYTMIAVGVIGYFMLKVGIPIAPLLIGFILGPLIEVKLRQALLISRGDVTVFVTRPISAVLLALTLIVIVTIVWQTVQAARRRRNQEHSP
jgi:putative tricarboxylic transport membrane protein